MGMYPMFGRCLAQAELPPNASATAVTVAGEKVRGVTRLWTTEPPPPGFSPKASPSLSVTLTQTLALLPHALRCA